MSSILKSKIAIIFNLVILSVLTAVQVTDGQTTAYEGSIFVNINDNDKFDEYQLRAGHLAKTSNGKVSRFEKDGKTYVTSSTEDFKKLYYSDRGYRYDMEAKLADFFSPYDLDKLQSIQTRFFRHILYGEKQDINTDNIYLSGPDRKPKYFIDYSYDFFPNKQFSYVIYHSYSSSVLINVETKRITFPFEIDNIQHLDWSSSGQYVAYSFQGYQSKYMLGDCPQVEIKDRDKATLVIIDIFNEKTLRKKDLGRKYVADLTWSPDLSYIGVITFKSRLGVWPWELLFAAAGHPVYHNTFTIEIYDTKGNMVEMKELEGSYKLGSARIVWN